MPDLKTLHGQRQGESQFRDRDTAYRVFSNYFNSKKADDSPQQLTYRPYLVDNVNVGKGDDDSASVNFVRRVGAHFASLFAHPPRTWNLPYDDSPEMVDIAERNTTLIEAVFNMSNLAVQQPRQGHWLSVLGDCVYGIDWDDREGHPARVLIRGYNPGWCYPSFYDLDLGAVNDILIVFRAGAEWVKANYGPDYTASGKKEVAVYTYWTEKERFVQVEETPVEKMHLKHDLGFCPFRWVFAGADGQMGQADVREVPKLQDLYNENLELAIDAIRKKVDPAYYGVGLKKEVRPEPGVAVNIPEGASIAEFPMSIDPGMILGVAQALEDNIQAQAGISQISASGVAPGSIVTGTAVRHQVEAVEARVESRKAALQATFATLGSMILQVIAKRFPDREVELRGPSGRVSVERGSDIKQWFECAAEYGGFLGMDARTRVMTAMEMLGRLTDDHESIKLADLPGVRAGDMVRRIHDYQIRMATTTAEAQRKAQEVSGQGQGPQAPPGMMLPQRRQPPQAPANPAQLQALLAGRGRR